LLAFPSALPLALLALFFLLPSFLLALFFLLSSYLLPFFPSRSFSGHAIPQVGD
jgi:hypothetical protein